MGNKKTARPPKLNLLALSDLLEDDDTGTEEAVVEEPVVVETPPPAKRPRKPRVSVKPMDHLEALGVLAELEPFSIQTMMAKLKEHYRYSDAQLQSAVQHSFTPYLVAPMRERNWLKAEYSPAASGYLFHVTATGHAALAAKPR